MPPATAWRRRSAQCLSGPRPWLVPASGAAAVVAGDLIATLDKMGTGGRWLIVVSALVPPLLIFFALWCTLPSLRAAIPANLTGGLVWGMVLILSILPWPMLAKKTSFADAGFNLVELREISEGTY
jgi:hypothetical protein